MARMLLLVGCLINTELYKERLDAVTDDDGDGVNDDQGDCDDVDADRFPGAAELCDGIDNDCNDVVDDGSYDAEACDGVDNDCDGEIDEGLATTWFLDGDNDGYGNDGRSTEDCAQPSGHVAQGGDCDDGDAGLNPGATETCDEIDNDCDGSTDEDLATSTWYADADGDGYGTGAAIEACAEPASVSSIDGDCDDTAADSYPEATETIDGRDQDCSGTADDLDAEADGVVFEGTVADGRLGTALLWADLDADGRDDLVASAPGRGIGADPCSVVAIDAGDLGSGDFSLATTLYSGAYTDCGTALGWVEAEGVVLVGEPGLDGGAVTHVDGETALVVTQWTRVGVEKVGTTISPPGDFDGDGLDDVVVGAPGRSLEAALAGAAYVVPVAEGDGEIDTLATAAVLGDVDGGKLGLVARGDVDIDGDGYTDMLVSSTEYGDGGTAWFFSGNRSGYLATVDAVATVTGDAGDELGVALLGLHGGSGWWVGAPGRGEALGFTATATGALTPADATTRYAEAEGGGSALAWGAGGLAVGATAEAGKGGRVDWVPDGSAAASATVTGPAGAELGAAIVLGSTWALGAPKWDSTDVGAVVLATAE